VRRRVKRGRAAGRRWEGARRGIVCGRTNDNGKREGSAGNTTGGDEGRTRRRGGAGPRRKWGRRTEGGKECGENTGRKGASDLNGVEVWKYIEGREEDGRSGEPGAEWRGEQSGLGRKGEVLREGKRCKPDVAEPGVERAGANRRSVNVMQKSPRRRNWMDSRYQSSDSRVYSIALPIEPNSRATSTRSRHPPGSPEKIHPQSAHLLNQPVLLNLAIRQAAHQHSVAVPIHSQRAILSQLSPATRATVSPSSTRVPGGARC
jgi:hypothetical protein